MEVAVMLHISLSFHGNDLNAARQLHQVGPQEMRQIRTIEIEYSAVTA